MPYYNDDVTVVHQTGPGKAKKSKWKAGSNSHTASCCGKGATRTRPQPVHTTYVDPAPTRTVYVTQPPPPTRTVYVTQPPPPTRTVYVTQPPPLSTTAAPSVTRTYSQPTVSTTRYYPASTTYGSAYRY